MKDNAIYPPKEFTNEEARKLWPSLDLAMRIEIVRACRELSEGVGMAKDAMMGRPKHSLDGFFGLARAEREFYELECAGVTGPAFDRARERLLDLRAKLQGDEAEIRERREVLRLFGPLAEAKGQSLAEWCRARVNIESDLRGDPLNGIFKICDLVGHDPLMVLTAAARNGSGAGVSA